VRQHVRPTSLVLKTTVRWGNFHFSQIFIGLNADPDSAF
jgi:hypothetical protein